MPVCTPLPPALLWVLRCPRSPWRALHLSLRLGYHHPLVEWGPRPRTHHQIRHRSPSFRYWSSCLLSIPTSISAVPWIQGRLRQGRSADLSEATRQAGLGIRTQVSGMSAMCRSMRTTLPMLLLSRARRSRCSPSHARGFEGYQGYPKTGRPCSCAGRGRQGWKLGLPIPAAGSQQARPHSLLQPRVNYFSLPQRPQLRRPNRSLTGVGTTPRIGSSPREGNPSLL